MQIDYFIGHKIFTLAKANVRYRDVGNRDILFFLLSNFMGMERRCIFLEKIV